MFTSFTCVLEFVTSDNDQKDFSSKEQEKANDQQDPEKANNQNDQNKDNDQMQNNTEALMVEEFSLDEEILRVLGHNPVSSEGIKFDMPVQVKC